MQYATLIQMQNCHICKIQKNNLNACSLTVLVSSPSVRGKLDWGALNGFSDTSHVETSNLTSNIQKLEKKVFYCLVNGGLMPSNSFLLLLVDSVCHNKRSLVWIPLSVCSRMHFGRRGLQPCGRCSMSALKASFREAPARRTLCAAMIASLAAS